MKQTVTIGDTTLLVSEIVGWRLNTYRDAGPTTSVWLRNEAGFAVNGDHCATLDAAVNDPSRQMLGCALVEHGGASD